MLTPILATDDPYVAAVAFTGAGWSLVFQTPPDSGDPLACVGLAGAQVMLGTSLPQFLADESREHKGAGVEFHVTVPAPDIDGIFAAHRRTPTRPPILSSSRGASERSTRCCSATGS